MHDSTARRLVTSGLLFLAITLIPLAASAESGDFVTCLTGCVPGENSCVTCCEETFAGETEPTCMSIYSECFHRCESLEGTRAVACLKNCQTDLRNCGERHPTQVKEFNCPNWVAPQQCPHECQVWHPASRRCVGAPKEVCD